MKIPKFTEGLERDVADYLELVTQRPQTDRGEAARQKLITWFEDHVFGGRKCS